MAKQKQGPDKAVIKGRQRGQAGQADLDEGQEEDTGFATMAREEEEETRRTHRVRKRGY